MNKIIARKRWFFLFSLLITVPGLLFTLATPISGGAVGLKFSIDYTGGTIWEFRPATPADPLVVQAAVAGAGHEEATVTEAGTGFLIVRTKPLDLQVGSTQPGDAGAERGRAS
jgi:preprotein translocase subunit SecF